MSLPDIFAVHRRKIEEFIKKLGLYEKITNKELTCHVCGVILTLENIGIIIPYKNEIILCCSDAECIFELTKRHKGEYVESD